MKISDELRETAGQLYQGSIRRRFIALASRIDAEMVELPKDRKGRTLHISNEVLVYDCYGSNAVAQGKLTSLTLVMLDPIVWYAGLCMGAVGDMRFRASCDGFAPDRLERIEVER